MSLIKGRHSEQLQAVINWGTRQPKSGISPQRHIYIYICACVGVRICIHTCTYYEIFKLTPPGAYCHSTS